MKLPNHLFKEMILVLFIILTIILIIMVTGNGETLTKEEFKDDKELYRYWGRSYLDYVLYNVALGLNKPDLDFWWNELGSDKALWDESDSPPDQLADLWQDMHQSIEDVVYNWKNNPNVASKSYYSLWDKCSRDISKMCSAESIGLWSLGL